METSTDKRVLRLERIVADLLEYICAQQLGDGRFSLELLRNLNEVEDDLKVRER